MFSDVIVLKLGGSLVAPKEIDTKYLKSFGSIIKKHTNKDKRFVVIVGGGYTNRWYRDRAKEMGVRNTNDLHWIGIAATRLNAELVRTLFGRLAHPVIYWDLSKKVNWKEKVLISAGYKPGCSTDQDAVLIAKKFKTKTIIKLTNVDYVYTKDPKKFKNAKIIKNISWKDYLKVFGNSETHKPGQHIPFDTIAAANSKKNSIEVFCLGGKSLKNLDNLLSRKPWRGTKIHG
ncbi:MAG: hypothetical protein US98_C0019G0007 [Parcubacteria group bacterium GW2011_GWC1_38_6]|nr:MAG: hypothetical protein US98_C0019G0007 [Parcubacteria group bacterium GW2011_GWC1_38_6]